MGNSLSSTLFYPDFVPWRGHSSFAYNVKTLDAVPSPPYRAGYHSLSRLKDANDSNIRVHALVVSEMYSILPDSE